MVVILTCQETSDRIEFNDCTLFMIEDTMHARNYCDLSASLYIDMTKHTDFFSKVADLYQKDIVVNIPSLELSVKYKKTGIVANDNYIRLFGEESEWI